MNKIALHLSPSILDELTELEGVHAPGNTIRNEDAVTMPITLNNENRRSEVINSKGLFYKKALESQFRPISDNLRDGSNITHHMSVSLLEGGVLNKIGMRPDFILADREREHVIKPEDIMNILSYKSGGALIEGLYSNGKRHHYGIGFR